MATRDKNFWVFVIFLLCGLVVGGLLGELASNVSYLQWMSYGESFGLTSPLVLDMKIFTLSFALTLKINIASIIGLAIAIFIYKKAY